MLELSFLLCESSVKVHGTKAYVQKALPLTGVEVAVTRQCLFSTRDMHGAAEDPTHCDSRDPTQLAVASGVGRSVLREQGWANTGTRMGTALRYLPLCPQIGWHFLTRELDMKFLSRAKQEAGAGPHRSSMDKLNVGS